MRTDRASCNGGLQPLPMKTIVSSSPSRRHKPAELTTRRSTLITGLQLSLPQLWLQVRQSRSRVPGVAVPVYALIAAVIVLDLSPSKTQQLAVQRLLGTYWGQRLALCSATHCQQVRWQSARASWSRCCLATLFACRLRRSSPDMSVALSYCLTSTTLVVCLVQSDRNLSGHRHGRAREPCAQAAASRDTHRDRFLRPGHLGNRILRDAGLKE